MVHHSVVASELAVTPGERYVAMNRVKSRNFAALIIRSQSGSGRTGPLGFTTLNQKD